VAVTGQECVMATGISLNYTARHRMSEDWQARDER